MNQKQRAKEMRQALSHPGQKAAEKAEKSPDKPAGTQRRKQLPEYAYRLADLLPILPTHVPDQMPVSEHIGLRQNAREIIQAVKTAPVIVADNVCKYVVESPPSEKRWDVSMPRCLPPFAQLFIEWHRPAPTERTERNGYVAEVNAMYTGVYVTRLLLDQLWEFEQETPEFGPLRFKLVDLLPKLKLAKWVVSLQFVVTSPDASATSYCGLAYLFLDEKGFCVSSPTSFAPECGNESFYHALNDMIIIAAYALGFINCKNVERIDVDHANTVKRKRQKHNQPPLVRYQVLEIDPAENAKGRTERGEAQPSGEHVSQHICRGHFVHFKEEAPMFGKPGMHGTFWKAAHVRGNSDVGTVVSDYSIKSPG